MDLRTFDLEMTPEGQWKVGINNETLLGASTYDKGTVHGK
jgi:hypothetical protein